MNADGTVSLGVTSGEKVVEADVKIEQPAVVGEQMLCSVMRTGQCSPKCPSGSR